jgi:hypothetical protein
MTDPVFQQAYENVRCSRSDEAWRALTPAEIASAIYQEIRRLDALAVAAREACVDDAEKPPSRGRH